MQIREIERTEKQVINAVVSIHLDTFQGFFLTFMGRDFLQLMYSTYCKHDTSGLLVAFDDVEQPVGFLAYSSDMSGLYRFMIRRMLFPFAWYSMGAFLRKPKILLHLIRAFLKPNESKCDEKYVRLASIGVSPNKKSNGTGSKLIDYLKDHVDFSQYAYIALETDGENNDRTNAFYLKNGFVLDQTYETPEGRKMNEYHYFGSGCA